MMGIFISLQNFPVSGISKGDVKVSVSDRILTIQGRSFSEFVRKFGIPEACKEDRVKASFQDGLLEITIPKEKSEKLKKKVKEIPISSGK
jgi:HSP20 family protein